MAAPPNPYSIRIDLFLANGTRPNQNQIARVKAFDVNGSVVTDEGQSGFDPNTGGWQPVFMQNIAAFYPPREKPNLRFQVVSTAEQVVHTTQIFSNIPSGSTVKIVIGVSDELVGGSGGLTFTGAAKLVVHAKTATKAQRYVITGAQNPGTLDATVGATYNVVGNGDLPWTLQLQQKEGTSFVDRALALGPATTQADVKIQFVVPADLQDITARVEQSVAQPSTGTTFAMVRGLIAQVNGQPLQGVTVALFSRKARGTDTPLGDAVTTGADGRYIIVYKRTQPNYDLYVRATQGGQTLATSSVVLHAGPDEAIDLVTGGDFKGPSELEQIRQGLDPVLSAEGLQVSDLAQSTDGEFALFSVRSGAQPTDLVLLGQSAALQQQTGIAHDIFYAFGRQHISLSLPAILGQAPAARSAALDRAFTANQLSESQRATADAALQTLNQLSVTTALSAPTASNRTTLGGLLATAGLSATKRTALVNSFVAHTGTAPQFWAQIRAQGTLTASEVTSAQFALQLGVVTQNHLPLVQALLNQGVTDLKGLAKFDQQAYLGIIRSQVGGAQVGVPADLAAAAVTDVEYAGMVYKLVEDAVPTATIAQNANAFPRAQLLTQMFTLNPSYDIQSTTVNAFLAVNPNALNFISDTSERSAFQGQLKGMERLFRLAPSGTRVSTMQKLLNAGVTSANQISTMGQASFQQQFGSLLGASVASQLFAKATNTATLAATLLARYGASFDRTPFAVTAPRAQSVEQLPDYQTLFGSLDFCSCENCQSAFSAAAYLVDVLHWLDSRPRNAQNKTPLTVMFENRRADIGTIELSCANTNTPLPYLDLVNEVLELQVAPSETTVAYQTHGDPGDLAAHPEHLRTEAYDVVAGAVPASGRDGVYPFNLPFNLWLDEARTYLGHLGLPRYTLIEAFHAGGEAAALVDPSVAQETLALSPLEAQVIAGAALTPARTPQDFWGLSGDGGYVSKLKSVSTFLTKAAPPLSRDGMDYAELTDLVKTSFVQSGGALGIWFNGTSCDTTNAILPGLSAAHLALIHRFVRLRRRLGWSAADLDRAIQVLGGGQLSDSLLVKLAAVRRLQSALRLELPELLTWWGLLDTRRWAKRLVTGVPVGAPTGTEGLGFVFNASLEQTSLEANDQSFYDRLFLSRSVTAEPDAAFFVNPTGSALLNESALLADHSPTITAALGITADDLAKFEALLPNAQLSLANLSTLFRHVSLARALGLDAASLVTLLALTAIQAFDPEHPENAVLFVDEVKAIRASGFAVEELDYLLRHLDTKPASLEPQDEPIGVLLLELRDLLRKALADNPDPPANADATQLRERSSRELAKVLPPDVVTAVLSLVDLDEGAAPPAGAEALIDDALSSFLDAAAAKNALARPANAAYLADRTRRLRFVLGPLVQQRRAEAVRATVIDKLGISLGLTPAMAAPVLDFVFHPGAGGRKVLDLFSDAALIAFDDTDPGSDAPRVPGPLDFPDQFAAYKRLNKVALVLTHFRATKDEVAWLFGQGPGRGTLDFQTLPIAPPVPSAVQYGPWARLRDAFRLRDRVLGGKLFDLFEAATLAQAGDAATQAAAFETLLSELVKRTRWNRDDIEFLAGAPARGTTPAQPSALGLTFPESFRDERGLVRMDLAMSAVRRVGLAAKALFPWRIIPTSTTSQAQQATDIKQAVRAALGEARWRQSTPALRDLLREKQRDALAGWLIAHAGFTNVLDLFDFFLLDVEMSACQLTSRIKQAISSVQLFVQRALLNGEPKVALQPGDAREWKWMKSFRVWEANRRVFLYPENYIEPELRDDKTPFFKELEDELLQSDLDDDAAETAVLGYLEKLDDVARLEIAAVCRHQEDETNIVHVFGRTRSAPHRYFHRQWVDGTHWTAWEKVELDIESDQLLPVVHNRRLYLFWLLLSETAVSEVVETPSGFGNRTQKAPEKYFQIKLAWSERRNGKWTGKKLSSDQIGATDSDYQRQHSALSSSPGSRREFFLNSSESGADLILEVIRSIPTLASQAPLRPTFDGITTTIGSPIIVVTAVNNYRMDRFRFSGCDGTVTLEQNPSSSSLTLLRPDNTLTGNQAFVSLSTALGLSIPRRSTVLSTFEERETLHTTPTAFRVVPTQPTHRWSEEPFFFEDLERTFFVVPTPPSIQDLASAVLPLRDGLGLDLVGNLDNILGHTATIRPLIPQGDPLIYDKNRVIKAPTGISLDRTSRVLPGNLAARGGALLADSVTPVLETLGSTANALGADALVFSSNQATLAVQANFSSATGSTFKFGSATTALKNTLAGAADLVAAQQLGSVRGSLQAGFQIPALGAALSPFLQPQIVAPKDLPFRFQTFYHPFVRQMVTQLNRFGLQGLLDPPADGSSPDLVRQQLVQDFFAQTYQPKAVSQPYPRNEFDFSYDGAYSIYNWELFFHVPFTVAVSLTKNRRFEDALRWFHFIFDPSQSDDAPSPQRVWKVRPFFELFFGEDVEAGPIHELLLLLQDNGSDPAKQAAKSSLLEQISALSKDPFNPHALARLRPVAYQKAVIIKYLDNLIEWGDELFRRDTMESINEATLLYVLAARLLGPRPRQVAVDPPAPQTFNDLRNNLDAFSNALVEIEPYVTGVPARPLGAESDPPVLGKTLFFCIPPNDKLLMDGWDRVEDRLFKIRHCMNIEGTVRQLPLFEPPIDPALLVRAAAAGIDLGSVLSDVGGSLPLQRYAVLAQRAVDLCNDVRSLGQALLTTLEKKDGEALSLLRSDHEIRLLNAITDLRQRQVDEANEQLEGLRRSRELSEIKLRYYRSREFMNTAEKTQFGLMAAAGLLDVVGGVVNLFAAAASALPEIQLGAAGFGGTPVVNATIGGGTVSNVTGKVAEALHVGASALDRAGNLAGILGSHQRRADEWQFLGDQAQKEMDQLDRQITAAEIRVAIAEKELDNHRLQIEQAQQVEDFLRSKFTSEELYSWMLGQISSLYFQSYKLAYDVARRAERAWQFELALPDKTFIQFGYWDGLRKGLLAGDRLHFDLQRMATAYLDENRREYELTRHVSLRQLDPMALISLRRDGECFVRIPEAWFDLDSPGHYLRRLKTVSVSLPSVTGPYVSVRLTLTLVSSSMRTTPDATAPYSRKGTDDPRFRDDVVGIQSIVTSRAEDDAGLFETNLRDERYLPFEGAGSISEWRLELPAQFRQFDYETISDVILHLRYTAREGGTQLKQAAEAELTQTLQNLLLPSIETRPNGEREGLLQLVSLASDLPDVWHRFLHPADSAPNQSLSIELSPEVFPFGVATTGLAVTSLDLILRVADTSNYASGAPVQLQVKPPTGAVQPVSLTSTSELGGLPHGIAKYGTSSPRPLGNWTFTFDEADNASVADGVVITVNGHRRLNPAALRDLFVVVRFRV